MKICAWENGGGGALTIPNWNKFSEEWRPDRAHIPDLDWWFVGEATKVLCLIGKRFPVHEKCDEPYCHDLFFRQGKPEKVGAAVAVQLEKMAGIMGDRPRIIMDDSGLPLRTWPYSTRRNAWGLDSSGKKVVDRKWITTKQEVALTLRWLMFRYLEDGFQIPPRIHRGLEMGGIMTHLRAGEIDPYVAEWRRSSAAWPESRFETPRNAEPFDVRSEERR